MASSGHAIAGDAVRASRRIHRARNRKGAQLHELARVAVVLNDGSDDVRPIVAIAAAAEVIFAVVVELEGLSTLQSKNAVQTPTVLQLLHAATHLGELIREIPGEALWQIEVRGTVLPLRTGA